MTIQELASELMAQFTFLYDSNGLMVIEPEGDIVKAIKSGVIMDYVHVMFPMIPRRDIPKALQVITHRITGRQP